MSHEKTSRGTSTAKSMFIWFCLYAAPLFLAAGAIAWWSAWAYVIANFLSIALVTGVVYKDSADLARERAKARTETKPWDKIIVLLTVAVLPLASNILAGLDRRFGWTTSVTNAESMIALAVLLAASGLIFWSMRSNRFFSSHFRIQADRGHVVVSSGPYAIVRHPGYSGMILGSLAVPVLLGSAVALPIGIVSACLIVLRTWLEDRALQAELSGYREYAAQVRRRLMPFLW